MSEELIRKGYGQKGEQFSKFEFYDIGNTSIDELASANIIPKKNYGTYKIKKPDALICDRRNKRNIKVVAVVEYKQPLEFNTEKKILKALKQCNNYCQELDATVGIITDKEQYFWINPVISPTNADVTYTDDKRSRSFSYIKDENGNTLKTIFDHNNTSSIEILNKILLNINEDNSSIAKADTISPSLLAKKVWQSIWLATGDDPKKCLMTFTELFIFKFLSDLKILKTNLDGVPIDFDSVYNTGKGHCLNYYLSNVRPYIREELFPLAEDGTTIINGLSLKKNQDQDALFYGILDSFKEYGKLKNIDPQFKSRLYEDFLKGTTGKKQLAQFFTPRNVIKAIVDLADVKNLPDGEAVLDPAGGVGGFIIETFINRYSNGKEDFTFNNHQLTSKINYKLYDYDEATIVLAKSNMLICLTELLEENPTMTKEFAKILNQIFKLTNSTIVGSLKITEDKKYKLIMSNPPYISKGLSLYKEYIKSDNTLKNFYSKSSVGKEGLFIQKIVKELMPEGKAFIIIPDGVLYRPMDNNLKEFIIENCFIECIVSLPEKTFYSTDKKTYILGITKKNNPAPQKYPVLCGIIQNIGETLDVNRIPTDTNQLLNFVSQFKFYNADKQNYKSNSGYIKLIDFNDFQNNLNWIIENYWTPEEKVKLGLEEPERVISNQDISDNIDYFQSELITLKKEIEDRFNQISEIGLNYHTTNLFDDKLFQSYTSSLGNTKKEYSKIDTKNKEDIPLYTAKLNPVAHIKELKSLKPFNASINDPHISFASDGDGTAGTNIILHIKPYYLNTSRISFSIKKKGILPEYIFYFIQDMKKRYGFNYRHKANQNNIKQVVISIPVNAESAFDVEAQKVFISEYKKLEILNATLSKKFFLKIEEFEIDVKNQLDKKFKESFNIE